MSQDDRPAWWARASDPWARPADPAVGNPADASGSAGVAAGEPQGPPTGNGGDEHPTEVLGNPAGPAAGPETSGFGAPPAYGTSNGTPATDGPPVYGAPPAYGTAPAYPTAPVYGAPPTYGTSAPSFSYGGPAGEPQVDTLGRPQKPPRRPPGWSALVGVAAAVALVAGLLGGYIGAKVTDSRAPDRSSVSLGSTPPGDLSRPADSVAGIANRVLPTVVSIEVRSGSSGGTGSGFVLTADGYLLTNNHVVAAAGDNGTITVTFNDGSKEKAEVVGRTVTYDLAVIKVDRTGLPVAELGNSDEVVVGDAAIAVGSPLGLSGTVTSGIISAVDRPVTAGEGNGSDVSYIAALQTDAAINPGNSGGPLVDSGGRVIGVNSAIATLGADVGGQTGSIGLGFSIPINQARRTAEQLIHDGKASYPIIGASLDPSFSGDGARIGTEGPNAGPGVTPGGPADLAGIEPGDVITSFDGHPVSGPDELIVAIRAGLPGDKVTVVLQRNGTEQTVQVVLGEATD